MQWWVAFCYGRVYMWVPHQGRLLLVWNRLFKIIVHWSTRPIIVSVGACAIWAPEGDLHSLSLWCAGQRPDHQHTHKLTINTSTTWPSTQAQVQPNNEQLSSQASINTTSTTISNQQHWIQRTFLRHSGQVTGNYSPMKIPKLHTKRFSSSKKINIRG